VEKQEIAVRHANERTCVGDIEIEGLAELKISKHPNSLSA
jgi:hypothetical protein